LFVLFVFFLCFVSAPHLKRKLYFLFFSFFRVRTRETAMVFPRLLWAYFFLFSFYYGGYPFGYSYVAMFAFFLLVQHAMLFCLNRYELPALAAGRISRMYNTLRMRNEFLVPRCVFVFWMGLREALLYDWIVGDTCWHSSVLVCVVRVCVCVCV